MADTLQTTPLHSRHLALGARMMPFAGFHMPVNYAGIVEEHLVVRNAAGLFDVSHMGEVFVEGPLALPYIQNLVTNDASKLHVGKAMYTVMCRPDGTVVDDLLVYRLGEERYLLVINAGNMAKDLAWMHENNPMGAPLEDASARIALLALQGPKAFEIASRLNLNLPELAYYTCVELPENTLFGSSFAMVSHTGYTGEPGLELYLDADKAGLLWDALLECGQDLGLKPCGLGARDTLRIEAGYCLYGNDLDDTINPLEAGLGWVVKFQKENFVGKETLHALKERGLERRLVGFVLNERGIPRHGQTLANADGTAIGVVTSGTQSPLLQCGIGLGFVPALPEYTTLGSTVYVEQRGRLLRATVKKPPFHTN